jgi:hypothetical protein
LIFHTEDSNIAIFPIEEKHIKLFVHISDRFDKDLSLQSTLCFLWSVLGRRNEMKKLMMENDVYRHLNRAIRFQEVEMNSSCTDDIMAEGNVVLDSHFPSFSKLDMVRMFCAITLMQLAEQGVIELLNSRLFSTCHFFDIESGC